MCAKIHMQHWVCEDIFEKSVKQSESKMAEAVMNNDMKTQSLRRTICSEQWWFCNLPDLSKQNHYFQWTNETWCDMQWDKLLW